MKTPYILAHGGENNPASAPVDLQHVVELFQDSPVAIACISAEENLYFITANQFYADLVGREPGEIIGKPLLEAMPELKGQGFDTLLKRVYDSGHPYKANEQKVSLIKNNEPVTIYVNFTYTPRKNAENKVSDILVTATDVTYQVIARKAVEEKEALLRTLIDAAPFPIAVYQGRNLEILYANPAIIDVYGKGAEVIGKKYLELLPELVPQGMAQEIEKVFETGQPFYSDTRKVDIVNNQSTQSYYFKYSFLPLFDHSRKVYGILNTGVDVTELELSRQRAQEAEAGLRAAVEVAGLANWHLDLSTKEMHLSPRLQEWLGVSKSAINLSAFYQHIPDEYLASTRPAYEQCITSANEDGLDIEHPIINLEGTSPHFVHIRGQVVKNEAGIITRLTGTMQDITDHRAVQWELERQVAKRTVEMADLNSALQKANKELEKANAELNTSNEELSQYAYVTSHDLQEPLRKIRVFASMLQEKAQLSPENDQLLQKVSNAAGRMTHLIQDLLTFSRLLGTHELKEQVDLNKTIESVLEDFELAIEEKHALISVTPLPAINGIALQLYQLFHNLIGNSLKFIDNNRRPQITISCRKLETEELTSFLTHPLPTDYYEILLEDNGIGFEPAYASHIFELFKQLQARDSYAGSGIGLALCRRIATNHGGHIYATSTPGVGSQFHVILMGA